MSSSHIEFILLASIKAMIIADNNEISTRVQAMMTIHFLIPLKVAKYPNTGMINKNTKIKGRVNICTQIGKEFVIFKYMLSIYIIIRGKVPSLIKRKLAHKGNYSFPSNQIIPYLPL